MSLSDDISDMSRCMASTVDAIDDTFTNSPITAPVTVIAAAPMMPTIVVMSGLSMIAIASATVLMALQPNM